MADCDLELKRRGGSRSWVTAGIPRSPLAAGERSRVIEGGRWMVVGGWMVGDWGRRGAHWQEALQRAACHPGRYTSSKYTGLKVEQRQRLGFLA